MKNILFYKYVELESLNKLKRTCKALCEELGLQGTVLIALEGINGCLTGDDDKIQKFKEALTSDKRFSDMEFKEADTNEHGFKKVKIKIKPEIVTSNFGVDVKDRAEYIEPNELREMFEKDEDFVMVDMRNNYESEVGVFDKTIALDIDNFREAPKAMHQLADVPKDKKVVAYCTGGVRCEKGSALLKKQGFKNVRHLHGGILRYGKEIGNKFWNGKCFVFDDRVVVDIDPNSKADPISKCVLCKVPNDHYENCKSVKCDKRFLSCEKCFDVLNGCCSKKCRNEVLQGKVLSRI